MALVARQPVTRSSVSFSLRRRRHVSDPLSIQGTDHEVELVSHCRYSDVQLDNKLDWSSLLSIKGVRAGCTF